LIYVPGNPGEGAATTIVWMNRNGAAAPIQAPKNTYSFPSLSPDGKKLAITVGQGTGSTENDVSILNLADGKLTRFTFGGGNFAPIWTRDGKWVTFTKLSVGGGTLFRKPADGSAAEERVTQGLLNPAVANSWAPGDKLLAFL